MKKAIYPGSFDPFHEGHLNIVKKALKLFDEVIIVVTKNSTKKSYFSFPERIEIIKKYIKNISNIKILSNINQLTVDFATNNNIDFIIRGIRNIKDVEYEISYNDFNKSINEKLETVLFISDDNQRELSSTILKELNDYLKDKK